MALFRTTLPSFPFLSSKILISNAVPKVWSETLAPIPLAALSFTNSLPKETMYNANPVG